MFVCMCVCVLVHAHVSSLLHIWGWVYMGLCVWQELPTVPSLWLTLRALASVAHCRASAKCQHVPPMFPGQSPDLGLLLSLREFTSQCF